MSRFSGTPLDCSFVSFFPQQTSVELSAIFVVAAVEKWKAFCAFQAQRLFHGHQAGAPADLVDQRRATLHQSVAHTVHGLQGSLAQS